MKKFTFSGIKKGIKALKGLTAERLETLLGKRMLKRDLSEIVVYISIAVYTLVFSYFSILKHHAFRSYAWDLGINNQAFWTTLNQGKLLYYTPELYFNTTGSFFGLHFSPIMFLVLPIYALHQTPETLLVFQSFILALGALPLYWLARDSLKNKSIAVTFSIIYLLYPILHGVNWFDFHVQAFLPIFFFLSMYYLKKERWIGYYTFIFLALAVAENVAYVVLFIGFYALWVYRKSLLSAVKQRVITDKRILIPLTTIILAIFWVFFTRWVQNTFFPIDPRFSRLYRAVDYYSVLGIKDDPAMLPLYVILHPFNALEALAYDAYMKFAFVVLFFGTLLFLPLKSGVSFITLAWLVPALLSNYSPYYMIGDHYPAYIIPFAFTAAVDAIKKQQIPSTNFTRFGSLAKNLLLLVGIFSFFASPLSPLLASTGNAVPYFSEYGLPTVTDHVVTLQRIAELVPPNASVLTQNNIFPHFSGRLNAFVLPLPEVMEFAPEDMNLYVDQLISKSEFILIDLKTDAYGARGLILSRIWGLNFGLLAAKDGIYLYKRGYVGAPIL